mmetsp:Transcript_65605/g.170388  ORF Transcript_65605/g.170388 Transcript_65605/m.170388 type:complete len:223 (+) Transcript_65605:1949-2617(+)
MTALRATRTGQNRGLWRGRNGAAITTAEDALAALRPLSVMQQSQEQLADTIATLVCRSTGRSRKRNGVASTGLGAAAMRKHGEATSEARSMKNSIATRASDNGTIGPERSRSGVVRRSASDARRPRLHSPSIASSGLHLGEKAGLRASRLGVVSTSRLVAGGTTSPRRSSRISTIARQGFSIGRGVGSTRRRSGAASTAAPWSAGICTRFLGAPPSMEITRW